MSDPIEIDVLSTGEAWHRGHRIAARSGHPELAAAKYLHGLGFPPEQPLHFRKMGVVTKCSTVGFLIRSEREVLP